MLHIPPCTCARGVSLLVVRMKKHHRSREVISAATTPFAAHNIVQ